LALCSPRTLFLHRLYWLMGTINMQYSRKWSRINGGINIDPLCTELITTLDKPAWLALHQICPRNLWVTLSSWLICFSMTSLNIRLMVVSTGIFSQPATSRKTPSDQTAQSFAMEVAPPIILNTASKIVPINWYSALSPR
jgi:hypothetical protein